MHDHGYSLTELDSMIPWEREIYVSMVLQRVKEENERIQKEQSEMARMKNKR
jgi:hypothetical protein